MTNIVIQGVMGRMGTALQKIIAERQDCRIVAGVDAAPGDTLAFPVYRQLADMREAADVLIDFSLPAATRAALEYAAQHRLPCVICTTGLDAEDKALMQKAAGTSPVFFSANMSLGINLLAELCRRAATALPGFDIEIIEKHHHNKVDAPSGTALLLADAINDAAGGRYHYVYDRHDVRAARQADEIGIASVRGGSIVGEHDVLFAGPDEVLTLSHAAYSRDVFANGAVAAAVFLTDKAPGMYSMQDMMERV